ncbi:single-stranded DNA-binding protein [Bacillus salipaludis]|uniref:Single-stranded DNA-binding protein n=1 Tax=Bacillus salipaludis TaxID=2547811 RepID=A0AA90QUK8_9BACI|nr:single-stranded DNA-binding protein [Bacillus salipaludis]MDQ6595087.1 single-stranded DNA-binding protein [Bacillus salipaludis]
MINQVTLVGRLTKDPELKTTSDGTSVTQVTLAVSRNFRNQNGEIEADFVLCTLWRKAAENTAQYCRKGSVVGVTGRLHTRNYEKEGKRVYITEVIGEQIRFLGAKPHVDNSSPSPSPTPAPAPSQTQSPNSEPREKKEEVPVGS